MFVIKHLLKNVFIISVFSIATRAIGFLFRIYLANNIGEVSLGVYQIGFSVFIVLNTLIASGLPLVVSKLTAKYRLTSSKTAQDRIVTASVLTGLAISSTVFLIILIFKPLIVSLLSGETSYYVLLTLIPSLFATSLFGAFKGSLWGQQRHFTLSFVDLIEEIVKIISAILLIEFAHVIFKGEIAAGLSLTISCFTSSLLTLRYYYKYGGKLTKPKRIDYKNLLSSATPITAMRVTASLVQPLIAIIVPLRLVASGLTNEQALSQLGVALGMTFPLLFLPLTVVGALSVTLIPSLASILQQKNYKELKTQINSSLQFTLFASCLFIPIYIGIGIPIGQTLFSNTQSGIYLKQAAYLMLPISLTNISSSILNAMNLEIKSFKNYILGSILLILSLWFLPKYIGIRALILGMGLCMGSISILNIHMLQKHLCHKFSIFKPILIMCLFFVPATLMSNFSFNLLVFVFPKLLAVLISATLGAISFVLLCIIFNLIKIDFFALKIKDFLKSKKQKSRLA